MKVNLEGVRNEPKNLRAIYLNRESEDKIWDLRTMKRKKDNKPTSNSQIVAEAIDFYYEHLKQQRD